MGVASSPPSLHASHPENTGIQVGVTLTTVPVQCLGAYQAPFHFLSCRSRTEAGEVGEDYQPHFIDEVDGLREANGLAQGHTAAR